MANNLKDEPVRKRTNAKEEWSNNFSTNLSDINIYEEREFRNELVNWLNNGNPKLFRSPTEGNFIVRLMNISLSPNDTLGRMLYTFSCTAYEVADLNTENLIKYNLVQVKE
jgi:hypothetical protein